MEHSSIIQLCIDLPEAGLMNECRRLNADAVTVNGTSGSYQLHITCDNKPLASRSFLCVVIDAAGAEYGEFAISCADVMKTMRGLYLRLSEICAYHLQVAYDSTDGDAAPVTAEALPEAGSAADQLAPLLPEWVYTTASGRRHLHRCLFDIVGAQMHRIDHHTMLAMMGIAPAAEAEYTQAVSQPIAPDYERWYAGLFANDAVADTTNAEIHEPDRSAIAASSSHYHGLVSRALN